MERYIGQKNSEIGEFSAAINRVLFSEEEKQIILEALYGISALDHMDPELAPKVAALLQAGSGESRL